MRRKPEDRPKWDEDSKAKRGPSGQYLPGTQGGPGMKKGTKSGRSLALGRLDHMLAKATNLKRLDAALQHAFQTNTMKFFKEIVMPLVPKQQLIQLEQVEHLPIRIALAEQTKDIKPEAVTKKKKKK